MAVSTKAVTPMCDFSSIETMVVTLLRGVVKGPRNVDLEAKLSLVRRRSALWTIDEVFKSF